jgi:hypothetical protein
MSSTAITSEQSSYPLMMHLGITPKHDLVIKKPDYNPHGQTSSISSDNHSWCLEVSSTGRQDGSKA